MRSLAVILFLVALGIAAGSCGEDDLRFPGEAEDTPTPTGTATASPTSTPTPTPSP